jgi:hypothetical protein
MFPTVHNNFCAEETIESLTYTSLLQLVVNLKYIFILGSHEKLVLFVHIRPDTRFVFSDIQPDIGL